MLGAACCGHSSGRCCSPPGGAVRAPGGPWRWCVGAMRGRIMPAFKDKTRVVRARAGGGKGGYLGLKPQNFHPTGHTTPCAHQNPSFPRPLASQGDRDLSCGKGWAGRDGFTPGTMHPGGPPTCSFADDFGNGGGEVPDAIGALLSVVDVPLPSPVGMLLQDLPWG